MPSSRPLATAAAVLLLAACQRAPAPEPTVAIDQAGAGRIAADVRVLAGDAMQGRETGTPGFDRAAGQVAARFRALGLQPAGDAGGWFQRVPLLRATAQAEGARLAVVRGHRTLALRLREQFLPLPDFNAAAAEVRAPAVFVGQAVVAPDLGQDDFAGLDVRGKVAVLFSGAPPRFDDDRRAFHAATREKLRALVAHGAIGAVFVDTAGDEAQLPWPRRVAGFGRGELRLRDEHGQGLDTFPQLRAVARVSAAAADLLFDGSGHTAAELAGAAQAGHLRGFALPVTLALAHRTRIEPIDSRNVLARLPGRDPALAAQSLAFTAHLDHLGVGAPVAGDAIYNGALDNALGVAILLEAARTLHAAPPRRPVLFAALTAEEQGLLGAEWLAAHPPAPLVAAVNLDMPMLLAPTRDVVPIGLAHSGLAAPVAQAVAALGLALSPDPFPEEAVFVRSDQYAFVRAGVPSVFLDAGVLAAGDGPDPKLAQRDFLRRCYHQPCDDVRLPIQYADAARLARLNARIGTLVGDAPAPPRWRPGDFFGDRFAPAPRSR